VLLFLISFIFSANLLASDSSCKTSNPVALPKKIQAENFCSSKGIKVNNGLPNADGTVISSFKKGDWLEFKVHSAQAQNYLLILSAASKKTAEIEVFINDRSAMLFPISPTGGSKTFSTHTVSLSLESGVTRIKLKSVSGSLAIDWLSFVKDLADVTSIIEEGIYSIVNEQTHLSLDLQDWSKSDGGNIQQWEYVIGENQQWQLVDLGRNEYEIVNRFSRRCLDLNFKNGNVQQWTCTRGSNQRWIFEIVAPNLYLIRNVNRGTVLTVFEGASYDGANVVGDLFGQKMYQVWRVDVIR
jgi:hypothetical protein